MNEYMLIYKGGDPEAYANTTHEDMAASIEKWGNWFAELEAEGKLAAGGSPLHNAGKRINKDFVISDIPAAELKELVSGYSIIKAASIEEAIETSKSCPIFESTILEVEVREIKRIDI